MPFFMNIEEKNLKKKHFAEKKSHSVFEGLKEGPFKHTKKKFCKMFLIFFQHS